MSGAEWTFTQLICLTGGPRAEVETLAAGAGTASVVRAIQRCRLYTLIGLKTQFCVGLQIGSMDYHKGSCSVTGCF